jgi:hypothetical protein
MIVKKLAVPLVNEKILQQAEHCYIATAGISDEGFEFIRSRLSPRCKIDIVTGLDELTSPGVLKKILKNYQGRINLNIYTRNILHANVFVFDLPFRKSVAFIGSGSLSLEGLKDSEEIFWKVTEPKEVESIMSWYTTYFQFSVPLSEDIARDYEILYADMRRREIVSKKEKDELVSLNSFRWEDIKFRRQFFLKDDYQLLSNANAASENASLYSGRAALGQKLIDLHNQMMDGLSRLGLQLAGDDLRCPELRHYPEKKITAMWLSYITNMLEGLVVFRAGIMQKDFVVMAQLTSISGFKPLRQEFIEKVSTGEQRPIWYRKISSLNDYFIEVGGKTRSIASMSQESAFYDFLRSDPGNYFEINVIRRFLPGDPQIAAANISTSTLAEFAKLKTLFE